MAEQKQEQKQQQVKSQYIYDQNTANFGGTQKLYYDQPQNYLAGSQTYKVPYVDSYYKSQNLAGSKVLTQSWIERLPYERSYIEYVPQQRIEYVAVEKKVEDYMEVQHEIEQVPVTRLEKYTEYVPVEKYVEKVEYVPNERSFVKSQSVLGASRSFQYQGAATTTAQPIGVTTTVQQPVATNVTTAIPQYSYLQGGYYPGAYSGLRSSTLKYTPNYTVPYSTVPYSSYVGYSRYPSYSYDRQYQSTYRPGYYGQSGMYYSGLYDRYPYQKYQ